MNQNTTSQHVPVKSTYKHLAGYVPQNKDLQKKQDNPPSSQDISIVISTAVPVQDGMFHADPHAGNVRLVLDPNAPGGAKPVLLDWGLIREITDAERLGLAKVGDGLVDSTRFNLRTPWDPQEWYKMVKIRLILRGVTFGCGCHQHPSMLLLGT